MGQVGQVGLKADIAAGDVEFRQRRGCEGRRGLKTAFLISGGRGRNLSRARHFDLSLFSDGRNDPFRFFAPGEPCRIGYGVFGGVVF